MSEFSLTSGVVVEIYRPSTDVVTVQPTGTPVSGEDGEDGADGRTILPTSGVPDNAYGANGDYAIDPTAWIIYGPKASGTWPAGVSIVGPAGPSGTGGGHPFLTAGG